MFQKVMITIFLIVGGLALFGTIALWLVLVCSGPEMLMP